MDVLHRIVHTVRMQRRYFRDNGSKRKIAQLHFPDFTIISNNCWGGWIYRYFKLPYASPTVGLFFLSEDYLRFVKDLKGYMDMELEFISPAEAHRSQEVRGYVGAFGQYPVGRLGDVDIHFLHYKSRDEAVEKWNRRRERINWNRMIVKMSQQNLWRDEYAYAFDGLELPNKLLFETRRFGLEHTKEVLFSRDKGLEATRDEGEEYGRYLNILKYINGTESTEQFFPDKQ